MSGIAKLALPQTRIFFAEAIHANEGHAIAGTRKVSARTLPSKSIARSVASQESSMRHQFEVWMPLENWNGRFQGLGLGAFWGALPYGGMAQSLEKGYAVGGTDTGHQSSDDGTWAMSGGGLNTVIVADWAHRGIHEMTVKSKAIVAEAIRRPAQHSYFTGCSSGGYQALTEAQRYPADYDGISRERPQTT